MLKAHKRVAGGILLLAALLLVGSSPARADVYPVGEQLAVGTAPLENPHFDAVVVSVISTDDLRATNGDPPTSRVRVEEVLRGRGQPEFMRVVWMTQPGPGDYEATSRFRDGEYAEPIAEDRWYEEALRGPGSGERLIVFYADEEADGSVTVQSAYSATDENIRRAAANLAAPERSGWIQAPVALVVLASPLACLVLLVFSLLQRFPDGLRRRFAAAVVPIPPLALLLYLFYESGISTYSNIRIDLLLIYPALFLAFLFWPMLLLRYLFGRR
jgi:hypothetical protein